MILILWTCPNIEEARSVVRGLVEQRLIACGNILPQIESIYFWKGQIESSQEVKVFLKTAENLFPHVKSYIQTHCSYEVPEITKIKVDGVPQPYLDWLVESVTR